MREALDTPVRASSRVEFCERKTKDPMSNKRKHETTPNSGAGAMIVMVIGGILVAALVVWALSRSMQRPPAPVAETSASEPTSTVATATGAATLPTSTEPPHSSDEAHARVPRVNVDDLKKLYDAQQVTIIDVRDADSYAAGHIAGALHIPMASIESQIGFIPKSKQIVTYCT